MILTKENLLGMVPKVKRADEYLPLINATLQKYEINTPLRIAAFLAQVGHESFSMRRNEDFGALEEVADGSVYEGSKILGNTQKGDGKRYKGRGIIQITGRYNYTLYSKFAGEDFVAHPEKLAEPQWAWDAAGWYWQWKKLNSFADLTKKDPESEWFLLMTKKINGGYNGLVDRQKRYTHALNYLERNDLL